jgi:hypothetical protein
LQFALSSFLLQAAVVPPGGPVVPLRRVSSLVQPATAGGTAGGTAVFQLLFPSAVAPAVLQR